MSISIIEFSTENFKIFKKKVTFSMLSRKSKHTFICNDRNLLRTSLIYGPNASGKSSLFQALTILRHVIINSANNTENSELPYHPFILSNSTTQPSFYEVVFSLNKRTFRYNFSVLKKEIVKENLFEILLNENEKKCLIRNKQDIKLFGDFKKSEDIKQKVRKETLFLSAASQWNDSLAMDIVDAFKDINVISGPESEQYRGYTIKMFEKSEKNKKKILDFLRKADFCIKDGSIEEMELPDFVKQQLPSNLKEVPDKVTTIYFSHDKFNSKNENIGIEKINIGNESIGTQKFFNILGPIVDTIEKGKVLLIDEFDNSLHPYLTKLILDLFENNNVKNSQLVVTTHDTSLLTYKEFSKEQIWFTEKDKFGAGSLFSLAEFDLRNDTEYSKKYLEGKFGALPFIESL